jgi:hypothetical protein
MKNKGLLFIALGVVVLAALFVWLKPAPAPSDASPPAVADADPDTADATAAATIAPEQHRIIWVIRDGQRTAGPQRVAIPVGDSVEIVIDSDHDDELHLHGYDLHLDVKANEPATLHFVADHTGRFDCELHHSDIALGALEVQPR